MAVLQQHQQQGGEGGANSRTASGPGADAAKESNPEALWHLLDAESLIEYWDRIEALVANGMLRLIITLSTLRYLDFSKTDTARARRIMRFIAAETRRGREECGVHLQHPDEIAEPPEALSIGTTGVAKHHRALVSAVQYFNHPASGWSPLVVLTTDSTLQGLLEQLGVDFIADIASYLRAARSAGRDGMGATG